VLAARDLAQQGVPRQIAGRRRLGRRHVHHVDHRGRAQAAASSLVIDAHIRALPPNEAVR
jgi:hypothetical protein